MVGAAAFFSREKNESDGFLTFLRTHLKKTAFLSLQVLQSCPCILSKQVLLRLIEGPQTIFIHVLIELKFPPLISFPQRYS